MSEDQITEMYYLIMASLCTFIIFSRATFMYNIAMYYLSLDMCSHWTWNNYDSSNIYTNIGL